jgi:hypothetical protein
LPIFRFIKEALTMDGHPFPDGMTAEERAEAQRLFEVTQQAMAEEQWRICCLMASKKDNQLLGQTEFDLRDRVLRVGAIALEAAVNQRRKKGATTAVASLARTANTTRASSGGGKKRS